MLRHHRAWQDIYEYYYSKGLWVFLLDRFVTLSIGMTISFAPILVFGCFDFSKLSTAKRLSECIYSLRVGISRCNFFVLACSFVFMIFNVFQIAQTLVALPKFIRIHKYFKDTLGISDHELSVVNWNEVIESIMIHESDERRSALSIVQEILKFDNYICALVSDPSILTWKLPFMRESEVIPMTRFFVYLLKLSLAGIVLDTEGSSIVNGVHSVRSHITAKRLARRFRLIGILLSFSAPFVLCFELLYLVFHYSQAIRNSPESLSLRRWTPHAKWIIREYNELPHLLAERISHSYEYANYYMDLFPSVELQLLLKMVSFFCGALLTILFVAGLFTDSGYLLTIEAIGNRSLAWLISVLASVYGICRVSIVSDIHPYTADECMAKVERHLHFDFRDNHSSAQSWDAYNKFAQLFQPIAYHLILEMFSVILNPILFLAVLPCKAESIVEFIMRNSVQVEGIGWICSFSNFDTSKKNFGGSLDQEQKMQRSMSYFAGAGDIQRSQAPLIDFRDGTESIISEGMMTPRTTSPLLRTDFSATDIMNEFTGVEPSPEGELL